MKDPLISGVYRHLSSALCAGLGYWEWFRNVGAVAWIDTGFDCLWWLFCCCFCFSSLWKKWVMCSGAGASLALISDSEILDALAVTLDRWFGEKGNACVPSLPPRGSDGFSHGGWEGVASRLLLRQSRG